MKKIIILIGIFMLSLLIVEASIFTIKASKEFTKMYQENSNQVSCEGNFDPSFPCENTYDGNFDTAGSVDLGSVSYVYFNYTKPKHFLNTSLWTIKDDLNVRNLTIHQNCFNNQPLRFQVILDDFTTVWSCWDYNTNNWFEIEQSNQIFVYEEAMWWDISKTANYKIKRKSFWILRK